MGKEASEKCWAAFTAERQKEDQTTFLVLATSVITSIGSGAGFISTLILSWRKDKREKDALALSLAKEEREQLAFEVDTERRRLENEKLALDIAERRAKVDSDHTESKN